MPATRSKAKGPTAKSQTVVAALSMSGAAGKMSVEAFRRLVPHVLEAANRISFPARVSRQRQLFLKPAPSRRTARRSTRLALAVR